MAGQGHRRRQVARPPAGHGAGARPLRATEYDWRACERRINSLPHFLTKIDGLDIHFIYVRSKHENALPIVVSHGWPGSIVEQLKIIEPLTNPTAHTGGHFAAWEQSRLFTREVRAGFRSLR